MQVDELAFLQAGEDQGGTEIESENWKGAEINEVEQQCAHIESAFLNSECPIVIPQHSIQTDTRVVVIAHRIVHKRKAVNAGRVHNLLEEDNCA